MTREEMLTELLTLIEDAPGEPGSDWIEERTVAITLNSTALAYMLGRVSRLGPPCLCVEQPIAELGLG